MEEGKEKYMTDQVVLSKEAILSANDRKIEPVEVPEWGGTIYVRSLSGEEREAYDAAILDIDQGNASKKFKEKHIRARLVVLAACDENGERLFGDEDIEAVNQKNAAALRRVYLAAQSVSAMGMAGMARMIDALKKGPSAGSTSG